MAERLVMGVAVVVVILFNSLPAAAQQGGYVFGTVGYGSLGDDEGSLGSGRVVGGGGAWRVNDRVSIELAVAKSRHERIGSLSWKGDPLAITVRALYWFGAPDAKARVFFGGGGGYFRYRGTFAEAIFDSPTAAPRIESRDWRVSGRAMELGGGVDVSLTSMFFVRPEAWLTVAGVERVRPAPEPPYALPRIAVNGGVRF